MDPVEWLWPTAAIRVLAEELRPHIENAPLSPLMVGVPTKAVTATEAFNRKAYMREYMRKRRAAARAE